jgi:hypothetical protein
MATVASIKVCEPVSAPLFLVEELQKLRDEFDQLRQENERLRQENQRLQGELEQAKANLEEARRQSKRQAAPFSKGPPKPQPKKPGRKAGPAHGRHGHRPAPPPARIDETLEAPLPDACPDCGNPIGETEVVTRFHTEIPRRPIIRQFNVHIGCCWGAASVSRAAIPCRHPTLWARRPRRSAPTPRPPW